MQLQEEHQWIVQHSRELEKHRGEWIAVTKTGIVASCSDKDLKQIHKKFPKALFFLVPRKGEENYVLWIKL